MHELISRKTQKDFNSISQLPSLRASLYFAIQDIWPAGPRKSPLQRYFHSRKARPLSHGGFVTWISLPSSPFLSPAKWSVMPLVYRLLYKPFRAECNPTLGLLSVGLTHTHAHPPPQHPCWLLANLEAIRSNAPVSTFLRILLWIAICKKVETKKAKQSKAVPVAATEGRPHRPGYAWKVLKSFDFVLRTKKREAKAARALTPSPEMQIGKRRGIASNEVGRRIFKEEGREKGGGRSMLLWKCPHLCSASEAAPLRSEQDILKVQFKICIYSGHLAGSPRRTDARAAWGFLAAAAVLLSQGQAAHKPPELVFGAGWIFIGREEAGGSVPAPSLY